MILPISVAVLSGRSDPIMSRHRDYGFCGMIAKPYEVTALGCVVNDVVHGVPDEETEDAGMLAGHSA